MAKTTVCFRCSHFTPSSLEQFILNYLIALTNHRPKGMGLSPSPTSTGEQGTARTRRGGIPSLLCSNTKGGYGLPGILGSYVFNNGAFCCSCFHIIHPIGVRPPYVKAPEVTAMNSFDEGTWSTGNGELMSTMPFTGTPLLISCRAASNPTTPPKDQPEGSKSIEAGTRERWHLPPNITGLEPATFIAKSA